ncbi:hypothetical protein E2C01_000681 [Portunus trituberculatus]|uniref:Uncharacterized protein n=1 Tax=Portunus trituberculatus TaxID=210409 RepID=A0A5B7CFA6_PORTR|nr:hypothetical protein [Portunus trituberculatus]
MRTVALLLLEPQGHATCRAGYLKTGSYFCASVTLTDTHLALMILLWGETRRDQCYNLLYQCGNRRYTLLLNDASPVGEKSLKTLLLWSTLSYFTSTSLNMSQCQARYSSRMCHCWKTLRMVRLGAATRLQRCARYRTKRNCIQSQHHSCYSLRYTNSTLLACRLTPDKW